jgi:putative ABC transport system permease protein
MTLKKSAGNHPEIKLAEAISLGIALVSVSWQSWLAATGNPVKALRYE